MGHSASVRNPRVSLVMRNRAFITSHNSTAPANFLEFQIWVPGAATRAVLVTQLDFLNGEAGGSESGGTACFIDQTQAPNVAGASLRVLSLRNGVLPSSVPVQFEMRTNSTPRGSTGGLNYLWVGRQLKGVQGSKTFIEPVVVMPGSGFTVINLTPANWWQWHAEFYEIPLTEL